MGTPYHDQAEVAALLETNFYQLAKYGPGTIDGVPGLEGFEVLNVGTFDRSEYPSPYPMENISDPNAFKAITVRDSQGNIYVHFNGTGDGFWGYNSAAYGPVNGEVNSSVQKWAESYFDRMVETYYDGASSGDLYVTGHSQGGNNAQYVTLASEHGDKITSCIELDGPGFSSEMIEHLKNKYGEAYYEMQREKIYAYIGESDFVSCLGQEIIIHDDHVTYIDTPDGYENIVNFHAADGLLDKDGHLNPAVEDDSAFRKFVVDVADRIQELPQDQQEQAAELIMKICENAVGDREPIVATFSPEEMDQLKTLLIPIVMETLEDNEDALQEVLEELGIDPAIAGLAGTMVREFNDLSPETRQQALEALGACITVKDNQIAMDFDNLEVWPVLKAALPTLWETAVHNPDQILAVVQAMGLDDKLTTFLKDHPGVAVAAVILLPRIIPLIADAAAVIALADAAIHIVEGIVDLAKEVKDFVLNCLQAFKEAIGRLREFLYRISPGVRYAEKNPYFKVDTAKMRDYAQRISDVNRRLKALDGDLRSLYWQVGLLDIWDILVANLVTSESPTLNQVRSYLTDGAERLEAAERKALEYMGG